MKIFVNNFFFWGGEKFQFCGRAGHTHVDGPQLRLDDDERRVRAVDVELVALLQLVAPPDGGGVEVEAGVERPLVVLAQQPADFGVGVVEFADVEWLTAAALQVGRVVVAHVLKAREVERVAQTLYGRRRALALPPAVHHLLDLSNRRCVKLAMLDYSCFAKNLK